MGGARRQLGAAAVFAIAAMAVVLLLAVSPPGSISSTGSPAEQSLSPVSGPGIYCLNKNGGAYVSKVVPGHCAAYGPGGTFGGGVNLRKLDWHHYGAGPARATGQECGFHLPCAKIDVDVKAFRKRNGCKGGAYTRLRATSENGSTTVRLPRCFTPAM